MSNNNTENKNQYGVLSMLAMIVGVVIGSGIYVVNNSLYGTSNSIGLSLISWILVSFLILFMLISFIEISSITVLKKKAGTVNNWARELLGQNFAKFVGVFFPIVYFPILLSGLSMILSTELTSNFDYFSSITQEESSKIWLYFISTTIVGLLILNALFAMNILTSKPGRIFQQVGTIIKLIPLFTLIIFGFIALFGVFAGANQNKIFDFNSELNEWDKNSNPFVLVLLMTPTVMFSFDGFLFAASLQNEAKKPSTYKVAAIFGIILIILVYVLMSTFAFMYGDPSKNDWSVSAVMVSITGWEWIGYVFSAMIIISVATGLSGNIISQNRMVADLSVNNQIRDEEGKLIARNKAFVPQHAAFITWVMAMMAFFVCRVLDLTTFIAFSLDDTYVATEGATNISLSGFAINGWALNFLTVISYSFYTIIIFSAILNRFSKKVAVEKNRAFFPSAIISVFSIFVIVLVFGVSIFTPSNFIVNETISSYGIVTYVMQIVIAFIVVFMLIYLPLYFEKDTKKFTREKLEKKEILIKAYNEQKVDPRYL